MYYVGGIGSVYFWDLDEGFAGVVLLKKNVAQEAGWDSIHVVEVNEIGGKGKTSEYKLTSTVILHLGRESEAVGEMKLAGSLTRQMRADWAVDSVGALGKDGGHVCNVGKLIEDMEGRMRNAIQEIYFGKAKDVVGDLRSIGPLAEVNRQRATQKEVFSSMASR